MLDVSGTDPIAVLRSTADPAAVETVVRRHAGRLLRLARRFLTTEAAAREAVTEGFRSARDSSEDTTLSTWVRRHAVRKALEGNRDEASGSVERLLPRFDETEHALPCDGPVPPLPAGSAPARAALDALPGAYRAAFVLRDVEGLPKTDAASLLAVPARELDTRLHQARQALVTLLSPR